MPEEWKGMFGNRKTSVGQDNKQILRSSTRPMSSYPALPASPAALNSTDIAQGISERQCALIVQQVPIDDLRRTGKILDRRVGLACGGRHARFEIRSLRFWLMADTLACDRRIRAARVYRAAGKCGQERHDTGCDGSRRARHDSLLVTDAECFVIVASLSPMGQREGGPWRRPHSPSCRNSALV